MTEIPQGFWAGLLQAAQTPQGTLNLIVLLTFGVLTLFLYRVVRRLGLRMDECEDAHLVRDDIQLAAFTLVHKVVGVLRKYAGSSKRRLKEVQGYELEAKELVEKVNTLNATMLERRAKQRGAKAVAAE